MKKIKRLSLILCLIISCFLFSSVVFADEEVSIQKVIEQEAAYAGAQNILFANPAVTGLYKDGRTIGYKVTITVSPASDVQKVLFPTWTNKDDQDDIVWKEGVLSADGTATCNILISEHNMEAGLYTTHIYGVDNSGNYSNPLGLVIKLEQRDTIPITPVIGNVSIKDVDSTGYTVVCDFDASYGINKVIFPTWTEANGQDDIVWGEGTISGNTATYRVNISSHNGETGKYITHVYAYNILGNISDPVGVEQTVQSAAPLQSVIELKDPTIAEGSYSVNMKFRSDVASVIMATWTEANGQDDIEWNTFKPSQGIDSVTISASNHGNESGDYINHIYALDSSGNILQLVGTVVSMKSSVVNDVVVDVTGTAMSYDNDKYKIDIKTGSNVARVSVATWTEANGQDDIEWQSITPSNSACTAWVSLADHNNEAGNYINHVYAYDANGDILGLVGTVVSVAARESAIVTWARDNSTGFEFNVEATATNGVTAIVFATWTEANDQDDITWQPVYFDGSSTVQNFVYSVEKAEHNNESGRYITHIYVYDRDNNETVTAFTYDL